VKTDSDYHKYLFANIVLSFRDIMFEGFPDRFDKEIITLAPEIYKIKVAAYEEKKYSCCFGGKIYMFLTTFA
jgi:actin-related protein